MALNRRSIWPRLALVLGGVLLLLQVFARPIQSAVELQRAREAVAAGDHSLAAGHLAKAAELLPLRPELWEQAGHYALLGGDPRQALEYLGRPQHNLSPGGKLDLGEAYARLGDLQAALQTWQAGFAESGSQDVEIARRLWSAQLASGDYQAAAETLESLVALQPQDGQACYRLGLLLAAQDPESAIEHLEQAARLEPEIAEAASELRGAILAASLSWRSQEQPEPGQGESWQGQGESWQSQGESGEQAYLLVIAGQSLAALGEWRLAEVAFSRAVQASPGYAEAWAYLGEARQHQSGRDAADTAGSDGLVEIRRAVELDPGSIAARLFLALYWSRKERFDLAEQAVRQAIALYPQEPVLYQELGRVLASSGDLARAFQAYEQASILQPENPAYLRDLVEFSLNYSYRIEEIALPAARQALLLAPRDVRSLDTMAQVMVRLGDLASAERYLYQALQIDDRDAMVHLHLGTVFLLRGQDEAALREFELVKDLAPGSPAADQADRLIEGMLK